MTGAWWIFALAASTVIALAAWAHARYSRGKAAELLETLTPAEQAIVDGTATTHEMIDALDRWNATELDNLRRAAEAAAREKANTEALVAGASALSGMAKTMDAIAKPTRGRRRRSPYRW